MFTNVAAAPVPSLLRDFSAPVKMTVEGQSEEQLMLMFAHDSDPFNRYDTEAFSLNLFESKPVSAAVLCVCGGAGHRLFSMWHFRRWLYTTNAGCPAAVHVVLLARLSTAAFIGEVPLLIPQVGGGPAPVRGAAAAL